MQIYKINPFSPDKKIIGQAVEVLKRGGVVVFPTETAYGLAADFLNSHAVKKIFQIKQRPKDKKLILIATDIRMVKKYFCLNQLEKELAKTYWPGPLTLILHTKCHSEGVARSHAGGRSALAEISRENKRPACAGRPANTGRPAASHEILPLRFAQGQDDKSAYFLINRSFIIKEAGVRISSNPIARKLCQKLGRPITATSANLSGQPACYSAKDIIGQLTKQKHQPDLILDAGKLPRRRVSTIAKVEKNKIKVIREGGIKINSKF